MSKTKTAKKAASKVSPYGSSFDDFLAESGILEEVRSQAVKAVFAWQLEQARKKMHINKSELARLLKTSRTQVNRLLDPTNDAVTLDALNKAAALMKKRVRLELVD